MKAFRWVMVALLQSVPVLGEAGDGFAADRPPFSAGSGVSAGLWHVDVPSRHLPPELQAGAQWLSECTVSRHVGLNTSRRAACHVPAGQPPLGNQAVRQFTSCQRPEAGLHS